MNDDSSSTLAHPTDFVGVAAEWLARLRASHRPQGVPLTPAQRAALLPYFDPDLLDCVRIVMLDRLSLIDDTEMRAHFPGGDLPIDLHAITGLTLADTVCIGRNGLQSGVPLMSVLFQELVHVAQFRRLGVRGFLGHYLTGWVGAGRSHDGIPLERQALALRRRFEGSTTHGFSVHQELEHHVH